MVSTSWCFGTLHLDPPPTPSPPMSLSMPRGPCNRWLALKIPHAPSSSRRCRSNSVPRMASNAHSSEAHLWIMDVKKTLPETSLICWKEVHFFWRQDGEKTNRSMVQLKQWHAKDCVKSSKCGSTVGSSCSRSAMGRTLTTNDQGRLAEWCYLQPAPWCTCLVYTRALLLPMLPLKSFKMYKMIDQQQITKDHWGQVQADPQWSADSPERCSIDILSFEKILGFTPDLSSKIYSPEN